MPKGKSRQPRWSMHAVACFAVGMVVAGCLPFATPPARLRAGVGLATHVEPEGDAVLYGEAGFHPLQLVEPLDERAFDIGAGYGIEGTGRSVDPVHGPHLEVAYFPVQDKIGGGYLGRWEVYGQGELLFYNAPERTLGQGFSVGSAVEIVGYASQSSASTEGTTIMISHAAGAYAIGLGGALSYRRLGHRDYWLGTLSITGRLPASFGLLCCLMP